MPIVKWNYVLPITGVFGLWHTTEVVCERYDLPHVEVNRFDESPCTSILNYSTGSVNGTTVTVGIQDQKFLILDFLAYSQYIAVNAVTPLTSNTHSRMGTHVVGTIGLSINNPWTSGDNNA
jgi:hypothetical protein